MPRWTVLLSLLAALALAGCGSDDAEQLADRAREEARERTERIRASIEERAERLRERIEEALGEVDFSELAGTEGNGR